MDIPASQQPTTEPPARFGIDTRRAGLYVITAAGELSASAATRLLRLVDARLRLRELGHVTTEHIVVDLAEVRDATAAGLRVLGHAHYAARQHGVGFALAGTAALASLPLTVRQALHRFPTYPTLAAARAALDQRH